MNLSLQQAHLKSILIKKGILQETRHHKMLRHYFKFFHLPLQSTLKFDYAKDTTITLRPPTSPPAMLPCTSPLIVCTCTSTVFWDTGEPHLNLKYFHSQFVWLQRCTARTDSRTNHTPLHLKVFLSCNGV